MLISYLRVSTQRQGDSGLGIEAQREAVRKYVDSVGGTLATEFVEVESGKSTTRPVLAAAMSQCRKQKATLVIAKLDRLARSVSFISALMETNVEFVAADMPAANRLMLHMMAAFAEFEREQISVRTKSALAAAKARGIILGKNGHRLAEQHVAAAEEFAEFLREPIIRCKRSGADTLASIAQGLNMEGLLTREGKLWGPANVQRVLRRLDLSTSCMGQISEKFPRGTVARQNEEPDRFVSTN
ncbi:MAG: hin [Sphingomonadales bacterium]|nr:hin [Sphingomonadales bacterium]